MTDPSPSARANVQASVPTGYRLDPDPDGPRRAGRAVTLWRLLVIALNIVGIPAWLYISSRPTIYEGPALWTGRYSAIVLVDRGVTMPVDDETSISVGGRGVSVQELRDQP